MKTDQHSFREYTISTLFKLNLYIECSPPVKAYQCYQRRCWKDSISPGGFSFFNIHDLDKRSGGDVRAYKIVEKNLIFD